MEKINIYKLENEYLKEEDILFSKDYGWIIKHIMKKELKNYERRLYILYLHFGSKRKAARYTGINRTTFTYIINDVEKIIKEKTKQFIYENNI